MVDTWDASWGGDGVGTTLDLETLELRSRVVQGISSWSLWDSHVLRALA